MSSKPNSSITYIIGEDPMTCPECGARTDFDVLADGQELHTCLNSSCELSFLAEHEDAA
jgi:hypothetical protein